MTQTLDNLAKQAGNMIKMYDIQKKKITKQQTPQDIQGLLKQIQKNEDKNK